MKGQNSSAKSKMFDIVRRLTSWSSRNASTESPIINRSARKIIVRPANLANSRNFEKSDDDLPGMTSNGALKDFQRACDKIQDLQLTESMAAERELRHVYQQRHKDERKYHYTIIELLAEFMQSMFECQDSYNSFLEQLSSVIGKYTNDYIKVKSAYPREFPKSADDISALLLYDTALKDLQKACEKIQDLTPMKNLTAERHLREAYQQYQQAQRKFYNKILTLCTQFLQADNECKDSYFSFLEQMSSVVENYTRDNSMGVNFWT